MRLARLRRAVGTAVNCDEPAIEIDVAAQEVDQLVEAQSSADSERHALAGALGTLYQWVRKLFARLDPRVDRDVLLLDPRHAMPRVDVDPFSIGEVRESRGQACQVPVEHVDESRTMLSTSRCKPAHKMEKYGLKPPPSRADS